jgi:hypothetical protein
LEDLGLDGRIAIWIKIKETEQKDADYIQLTQDRG